MVSSLLVLIVASDCFGQPNNKRRRVVEREKARAAAGVIDGAIWSFRLTPVTANANKADNRAIAGRYRISDLKLFQAEEAGGEMSKEVGISKPNAKGTTVVEFESISGLNVNKEWKTMKGNALLRMVKGGGRDALEGEFIDSDGLKWKLVVRRIQE
jgi:hypothetical protein